jgi:hypothetical protein
MSDSKHDASNLAEVKAVLGRLQRISRNSYGSGAETAGDDASPDHTGPVGIDSFAARANGVPPLVKIAVLIVPVLAVAAGAAMFAGIDWRPAPDKASPPEVSAVVPREAALAQDVQKPSVAAALRAASDFMASGKVRAARDVLLRITKEESADVAWALARSYDPNYLVTLRAADAAPDVAEATRWYRAWYDIAVKQGLVADSVSLERIIKSMN